MDPVQEQGGQSGQWGRGLAAGCRLDLGNLSTATVGVLSTTLPIEARAWRSSFYILGQTERKQIFTAQGKCGLHLPRSSIGRLITEQAVERQCEIPYHCCESGICKMHCFSQSTDMYQLPTMCCQGKDFTPVLKTQGQGKRRDGLGMSTQSLRGGLLAPRPLGGAPAMGGRSVFPYGNFSSSFSWRRGGWAGPPRMDRVLAGLERGYQGFGK